MAGFIACIAAGFAVFAEGICVSWLVREIETIAGPMASARKGNGNGDGMGKRSGLEPAVG